MFEPLISTKRHPQRLTSGVVSLILHGVAAIILFALTATHVVESSFLATPIYLPPAAQPKAIQRPIQPSKRAVVVQPVSKFAPAVSLRPAPKLALALPEAPTIAPPPPPRLELNLPPVPVPTPAPVIVAHKPEIRIGDFETPAAAAHFAAVPGKLQSSGFDSTSAADARRSPTGIAVGGAFGDVTDEAASRTKQHVVNTQGFDVVAAKAGPRTVLLQTTGTHSALEILSKPRPLYTDEARRLHIQGEVVLQVMFRASSEICVLRVIHGLGHGLDENAVSAAAAIRFRPATDAGRPVDDVAVVRISFQLAD